MDTKLRKKLLFEAADELENLFFSYYSRVVLSHPHPQPESFLFWKKNKIAFLPSFEEEKKEDKNRGLRLQAC